MLGILLLYFIWKYYSELAHEYNKSRWGYFFLGVLAYYGATALVGVAIGLYSTLYETSLLDDDNSLVLTFLAMPAGLLAVWGLYKLLEKRWKEQSANGAEESLDSDLIK